MLVSLTYSFEAVKVTRQVNINSRCYVFEKPPAKREGGNVTMPLSTMLFAKETVARAP